MSTMRVVKRQLKIILREKKSYLFLMIFFQMICVGVLPVISAFIPRTIIDSVLLEKAQSDIITSILYFCGISLFLGIVSTINETFFQTEFLSIRLKEFNRLNEKYQSLEYCYLESSKFRDYFKVASEALDSNFFGFEGVYNNIVKILAYFLSVVLYIVILISFSPWIILMIIFSTIVMMLVNTRISNYLEKKKEIKAKTARQKTYFNQVCYDFTYGKEIRVYGLKDKIMQDYRQKSLNYIQVIRQIANFQFVQGFYELICLLLQDSLAYFLIIYAYFNGKITIGDVTLYVTVTILLSSTIRLLTTEIGSLLKNSKYSKEYFTFMENPLYDKAVTGDESFSKDDILEIELRDVSFKYPNTDQYIYRHLNFKIHKKEKIAIVGINGCGKSTLIKLITGLYKVDEGEILINGKNINSMEKEQLNKLFSVVYQDIHIYACSVLENVIGNNKSLENRERGIKCIERVGLKDKIENFPKGYDQPLLKIIENDGYELSGGQNQKLAIARALYKDGNIVILDEPTANLDALAEQEIYQSFNDLVENKTAIYISHRLSSTKFCDKIALFSNEGLIEYGSHEELMKLEGKYFEMFETQGKYYVEGDDLNEEA